MNKIIALDIGGKRTGIAETDPLQIIATGLTTVQTKDLMVFLKSYLNENSVEEIVVGDPIQMDGTASESKIFVDEVCRKIERVFPDIQLILFDERFTSKMAVQSMVIGGVKKNKRREKALVDEISATIILQDHLHRKQSIL